MGWKLEETKCRNIAGNRHEEIQRVLPDTVAKLSHYLQKQFVSLPAETIRLLARLDCGACQCSWP